MCRDPVSIIFVEFGKEHDEKLKAKIMRYNRTYVEDRSAFVMVREMPQLMLKWLRYLNTYDHLVHNKRAIIYCLICFVYLVSPFDLIPEAVFGLVGYIDDFMIIGTVLTTITQAFLRQYAGE